MKIIQHLRATAAEWAANDIVIPDGEIALLKMPNGRMRMKIGNGALKFSDLPFAFGESEKISDALTSNIALKHGASYRCGELFSLTVTLPSTPDEDFSSEISFNSGKTPTDFTVFGGEIRFTGDGTADGIFMPEENFHYNVFIWYDGAMQGVVRGIPND